MTTQQRNQYELDMATIATSKRAKFYSNNKSTNTRLDVNVKSRYNPYTEFTSEELSKMLV